MEAWARDHLALASNESLKRFVAIEKAPEYLDDPHELRSALLDFIADFADWDNSCVEAFLTTSRALTSAAHESQGGAPGTKPLVIDPFSGGGAIPLEALRVGASAFGSDLNPVAVLLTKAVIEYGPTYGNRLAAAVREVGSEVEGYAHAKLADLYRQSSDGGTAVAYLWARTVRCEGPTCGASIPLLSSMWLSEKPKAPVVFRPVLDYTRNEINFEIGKPESGASQNGFLRRSSVTCPLCGFTTSGARVRAQFHGRAGGANDARLMAVVTSKSGEIGKHYRLPDAADLQAIADAERLLKEYVASDGGTIPAVPDEALPYLRSIFNIKLLDVNSWGELFTTRQLYALTTFREGIRLGLADEKDAEFAKAVRTCLALALDRLADYNSSLCRWVPRGEFLGNTFGRQALGIIWDFAEVNPLSGATGSWASAVEWIARSFEHIGAAELDPGIAASASATEQLLPDDSASMLCTDPPYYDLVPYADLSDFFYVWLRRVLHAEHPTLFRQATTPKEEEITQLAERNTDYAYKTRENYEKLMEQAMSEARRIVDPSGIGVVFFAHKGTDAWESQVEAMIKAGWIITASWPIHTEMPARLRAQNSAVLASSIQLVCRPRENSDGSVRVENVGDWRDVLGELPERIHDWMPRLAAEGVIGADAIFACLGPALEVFSRHSSVEKASGETVRLGEYLEEVWAAVSREALSMIFKDADASGFEEDARLTAMWLWTLHTMANGDEDATADGESRSLQGYGLEYDAARKIAQGLGAHLENLTTLVDVKGDTATLLSAGARMRYLFGGAAAEVPRGRRGRGHEQLTLDPVQGLEELEEGAGGPGALMAGPGSTDLDRLHQAMIFFGAGRGEALRRFLVEDGIGRDTRFWRLAQALSSLYPAGTDEKRWVDGVLGRKKGLGL